MLKFLAGFIISPIILYAAAYEFCGPGGLIIASTDPGAAVGFFDSPWTKALAAFAAFIAIIPLALTRSRSLSLRLAILFLDWHKASSGHMALFWENRAVKIWKRINPKDGKKRATSIRRVILAGYGLEPEMMPKAAKAHKIPKHILVETERDAYRGDNIVPIRRAA